MGMDAQVNIWLGVRREDYDIEEHVEELPEEVKELLAESELVLLDGEDYESTIYLNVIRCGDEAAGYGIGVFYHDWDYGVKAFDLSALQAKIEQARPLLAQKFKEWGIDPPVGVWVQTDFS